MAGKTYRAGGISIRSSGGLQSLVDRLLDGTPRRVRERLSREARELYENAFREWPVKSGRSKASLDWDVLVTPTSIRAVVLVGAEYRYWIRQPWPNNNRFVYRELIVKPGRKRAKVAAKDLGNDLRRLARRG